MREYIAGLFWLLSVKLRCLLHGHSVPAAQLNTSEMGYDYFCKRCGKHVSGTYLRSPDGRD